MPASKDMPLSSPDPLGLSNSSINNHSPTKRGRHPSITPRKALSEASGNPQVQEFYINTPPNPSRNASPQKSPRQTKQSTSPWRIRLTVQAEPVDGMKRTGTSPAKRLTERTTTVTVPLKGGDDTPPAGEKKGRGRPRKSSDGAVRRSGTPKPKAGGRRRTMPDSPQKKDVDTHAVATPPKKSRGRPRKSTEPERADPSLDQSNKNDLDVWLGSSLAGGEETVGIRSKSTRTRSRGRRQEITPVKIAVDSDIESQSNSTENMRDTPKQLAWTLGPRNESDQMEQNSHETHEASNPQIETSTVSGLSQEHSSFGQLDENRWEPVDNCDTRSASPHTDNAQDRSEADPTLQHQEFDSVLESEGFSMVSVSSLPSMGSDLVSPAQQDESAHEHTPIVYSSPSVPPAPDGAKTKTSPRHLKTPSDGTPKLVKVVRAGIALQGALSPPDRGPKLGSPFLESKEPSLSLAAKPAPQCEPLRRVPKDGWPEERLEGLFRGFGAGTRRELKAGLRLGEELAKRQRQTTNMPVVSPKEGDDVFQLPRSPGYPCLNASGSKEGQNLKPPGSEKPVRYPSLSNTQLPSPDRSLADEEEEDRMSWKADTPIKQEAPPLTSAQLLLSDESVEPNASAIDHTMMAREAEWQREREAVSRQIEMANKSQVIIIDSDDEEEERGVKEGKQDPEEDFADSDIWQSEAQFADQSGKTTPETFNISLQPELLKPRRSKIPSLWRRNSQVIYSGEVGPTESDLFWQPDQSQARASMRQNARRSEIQDRSDISAESVLDTSLENTRRAEAQIQQEALEAWPVEGLPLSNDEESTIAKSVEVTVHDGSTQQAAKAIRSPVVVSPSEIHTVPERPASVKEASIRDVLDVSEKIATLEVTEGISAEPVLRTSVHKEAFIDPHLFQRKPPSSSASNNPIRSIRPIQPLEPTQSSTSWLSRLTAPIWSVFAPGASLPPAATKEDILCSSPHEPLCQLTPWEECHFRALGPLYYGSLLYGAHLFPFNPRSPSARYCGSYVTTKLGWSRKIRPEDCGITDAFMVLLDERGYALGEPGARWIDEGTVIAMCVALWVGMVKRGEVEVDRSKGERIGLRNQGDRKWTKEDIDWASNQSAYFERKRREFDGLPSWKNKA